jgi:photosystem II stability/assembly factor-like uncharacterized protein
MASIEKINGISWADDVASVDGIAKASIANIDGITAGDAVHIPLWTGVGRDGRVMYSTDAGALTWSEYDSPPGAINDYWDISFGKDDSDGPRWIIPTNISPELRYSADPSDSSSWSTIDFPGSSDLSRTVEYSATGTWIAGDGSGAVFRSTDGGDSWTEITDVASGGNMLCLATDGAGTWLCGGTSKVLKSYDDGLNWYVSQTGIGQTNGIEYNNGVWFLASNTTTSYRATTILNSDTTDTWTAVTGISEEMWAICHISGDTWMAAPKNRYPYLSTDNCASWTQTGVASPGSGQIYALASDGTTVVLGNKSNKIYTSTDNGGSWTLRHSSTQDVLVIDYNKVKPF